MLTFQLQTHDLVTTRWLKLTLTNLVAQLTPWLVLMAACGGLGLYPDQVTGVQVFAAYSAALLLVTVPLTPGGLGTVDAALVALLVAFGADYDSAFAADLLWRLVWWLPQILVGIATMIIYILGQHRAEKKTAFGSAGPPVDPTVSDAQL